MAATGLFAVYCESFRLPRETARWNGISQHPRILLEAMQGKRDGSQATIPVEVQMMTQMSLDRLLGRDKQAGPAQRSWLPSQMQGELQTIPARPALGDLG